MTDAPRAGRRPVTALLAATNRRKATSWDERFAAGQGGRTARVSEGTGWTVVSYLLAGMIAYGGGGWLIGHFTHIQILFPIGMAVGLAISLGWIIYSYGRPATAGSPRQAPPQTQSEGTDMKEIMSDR
jgi:hypothetical protein